MSLLSTLLLSACPGLAPLPALGVDLQDPLPPPVPEQEGEEEVVQEKPAKKAFDKLSSSKRKKAGKALSLLRGGKTEEARAEASETLLALGEGVVPQLLISWDSMVEAERLPGLVALIDALLEDDALHLAWPDAEAEAASAVGMRAYVMRRWADSERKDAADVLSARIDDEEPELAYQAARGLALRGDGAGFDAIAAWVRTNWAEQAATLRADFAGIARGPMSSKAAQLANGRKRKDQLAGLHLFELVGIRQHAILLKAALSESDTSLRLAAINACRAAVDGDEPLARPSMTEIIERAETWKRRIDGMQSEKTSGGSR